MNALKMCLNWKVIAGVAAVGAGIFVFAPSLAVASLPFLVLAICPLSMVLMMGAMNGTDKNSSPACAKNAQPPRNREEQLNQLEAQHRELAGQITALKAESDAGSERRPSPEAAVQPS